MQKPEDITIKLNSLLQDNDQYDIKAQFHTLLKNAKDRFNLKFRFVDFSYYTLELMNSARAEKIKNLSRQNFKKAAENRDLEKQCQDYLELLHKYRIEQSSFYLEAGYLFYFHLSTANNDLHFSKIFKALV